MRRAFQHFSGVVLIVALSLLGACGPRWIDQGPATTAPSLSEDRFVATDGFSLAIARWSPAGEARGTILALHSFGDFRLAFERVGPILAAAGFQVIAPDQRGFGDSVAHGFWHGGDAMVRDLSDLAQAARAETPDVPLFVLGESMGGSVALAAVDEGRLQVDGLILAAPGVREALFARPLWNAALSSAATVAPGASADIEPNLENLTPVDKARIGNDPRMIREIRADTYWGLIRLADRASFVDAQAMPPTLLLYGQEDGLVRQSSICALLDRLAPDVTARFFAGGIHRLLHQEGLDQPIEDMIRWLDNRLENAPKKPLRSTASCI